MATSNRKPTTKSDEKATSSAPNKVDDRPVTIAPTEVDINMFIPVKNGFHGTLCYVSARTGEQFVWEKFGDEQDIELKELRNAKSNNKFFFENNYFMFDKDHEWVIDYLGIRKMYEHSIGLDGFDKVLSSTPAQIKKIVSQMPKGQKMSLMYCAKDKIASGEIDSIKTINALEDALGVTLIQK